MAAAYILVVDDEPDIRQLVKEILEDEGYEVALAEDTAQAREQRRIRRPDLILLDIWMPGEDGISLLREWNDTGLLNCPVVVMSGHGTIDTAVEATRLGATGFIEKPLSLGKLLATVRRTLGSAETLPPGKAEMRLVAGSHPLICALRETLKALAQYDASILLIGEPGTGKEMAARYLHSHSARRNGPFIALSSLPSAAAAIAEARHGSLFIDEVGEIDRPELSALLSRIARRNLGDMPDAMAAEEPRLICATRYDLRAGGAGGPFHELYLRLEAIPVAMPRLRDYAQDVPELLAYFVDFYCARERCAYRHFSIAAQNLLRQHSWPGNLAELRTLVRRMLLTGSSEEVSTQEVERALSESEFSGQSSAPTDKLMDLPLREAREAFERNYLLHQLQKAEGSVSKLAQQVGMERTHLYRKLRALRIDLKESN